MSVIFKTLIATFCLLICVVSINSDSPDNAKFTDTSISPEDLPYTNISPRVIPKRHKRTLVFRPLFVYRQQQVKKTRLKEEESNANHASSQEQHQPVQQTSNLGGSQEVHHHHHHHHHHHYPEGVQRTYDSRYQ